MDSYHSLGLTLARNTMADVHVVLTRLTDYNILAWRMGVDHRVDRGT